MTTRQIADVAGVSPETVRVKGKKLFPNRFANGKKTVFSQPEAVSIMAELRKKGFVSPTESLEAPPTNKEVVTHADLAIFAKALIGEMMKQVIPLIIQPRQLEVAQDYYTIKGYASRLGEQVTYSEAIALGREAKALSVVKGREVRKAEDERFGYVNSYHVEILAEVFQS